MALFLGRQPILDRHQKTYGYELLFRNGTENAFGNHDPDQATLTVIDNSFGHMGLRKVTGGKKAFINFTRMLLVEDYGLLLPKDQVVIEVLEGVEPDAEVIAACRRLKDSGHTIALDDFQYRPEYDPLIELVDLIKVDLSVTDEAGLRAMVRKFASTKIGLLAERVESLDDFERVKEMGYTYFQGYFFSRPVVLSSERVPKSSVATLQLLRAINDPKFDLEEAEKIIKRDPNLTMKLLRYVNSVGIGLSAQVEGIRHALALLGEKNIRKWATLLVLNTALDDRPAELMRQAIVRGRFCELLAGPFNLMNKDQELFMVGILSLLDTILGRPMARLLEEISVSTAIQAALSGRESPYRDCVDLAIAFESGDWQFIAASATRIGATEKSLGRILAEAFQWADELAPV
ncbi:MAG: HDOD domain-containing protein [Verrucomicrobia bacterium]|nr:HDOD domain-containing protein [Verrucomicrobiota bacterium]